MKTDHSYAHHDEDCKSDNDNDDWNTPSTSSLSETTFTTSGSMYKGATSNLQLRQILKRVKLATFCRPM